MDKENIENLEEIYNYTYICDKCRTKYGSDIKEKKIHVCPLCEKK